MTVRLGIVMDPIEKIHFKKDSSLAMLLAAQKRGWEIEYMELPDLYLKGGQARARTRDLTVHLDPQDWFGFGGAQDRALGDLDVILMRQDPPVDREFLMATFILELPSSRAPWWSIRLPRCGIVTKSCSPPSLRTARRR
jgi:glutathione synthase